MADRRNLRVQLSFEGREGGEDLPPARVYVFDRVGSLVQSEPVGEAVTLRVASDADYRVFVGPDLIRNGEKPPGDLISQLSRANAVMQDVRALANQSELSLSLSKFVWFCWWPTCIGVHGTVRKLINPGAPNPQYAPICSGTVQIFQVDLACTLDNVASFTSFKATFLDRLRGVEINSEALAQLRGSVPPPHRAEPVQSRSIGTRLRRMSDVQSRAQTRGGAQPKRVAPTTTLSKAATLNEAATTLAVLEQSAFNKYLSVNKALLWPFLCELIPDWWFCWQELGEVAIQSDGSFWAEVCFWCPADYPDLYFEVVQNFGAGQQEIYDPQIACSTYYDYDGSESVDIIVTDPTAVACQPTGGGPDYLYVEVLGITDIDLQNIDGLTTPFTAGTGLVSWWARPQLVPFGGTVGLNMQYHPDMKSYYYRWSYRFDDETSYTPISVPVTHYYQELVSVFPLEFVKVPVTLGPQTVNGIHNLYAFPDLTLDWTLVDHWADTFFAFFDTTEGLTDPPGYDPSQNDGVSKRKSGMCTLLLEIFDAAGNLVPCNNPRGGLSENDQPGDPAGPGLFSFLIPSGMTYSLAPTGNITDHGRLVFRIRVDNNSTVALLPAVKNDTTSSGATPCGFLQFDNGADQIEIDYVARQHSDFLSWGLDVTRGLCGTAAGTSGDGSSPGSPVPPGPPAAFVNSASTLLRALPPCDACPGGAAFAVNLNCWAWATNGRYQQSQYDSSATIAFALLPS